MTTATLPQLGWLVTYDIDRAPHRQCEVNSQPEDRDFSILFLASTFRRFALRAARSVCDDDSGFDLVAMLPAWATATLAADLALRK